MKINLGIIGFFLALLLSSAPCCAEDKIIFTYRGQTAWYSVVRLETGERVEVKTPFTEVPSTGNVTASRIADKISDLKAAADVKTIKVEDVK